MILCVNRDVILIGLSAAGSVANFGDIPPNFVSGTAEFVQGFGLQFEPLPETEASLSLQ